MKSDSKATATDNATGAATGGNGTATSATPVTPTSADKLPSDLFSEKLPPKEVLPLDDEVKKADYASLPDVKDIPPAEGDKIPDYGTEEGGGASAGAAELPLIKEDEQQKAKQTVDLFLKGYGKLHTLGRYFAKVDPEKLTAMHMKGEIDLNFKLRHKTKEINLGHFFNEYNISIDENVQVDEEFENDFRPPAERVCIKRKWFVDDEVTCALILGEDLVAKTGMLIGLKKSCNTVLEYCKMIAKNQKKKGGASDNTPPDNTTDAGETASAGETVTADEAWKEQGAE